MAIASASSRRVPRTSGSGAERSLSMYVLSIILNASPKMLMKSRFDRRVLIISNTSPVCE